MRIPRLVLDFLAFAAGIFWRRYGKNNYHKLHVGIGLCIAVIAGLFLAWDACAMVSPRTTRAMEHTFRRYFELLAR